MSREKSINPVDLTAAMLAWNRQPLKRIETINSKEDVVKLRTGFCAGYVDALNGPEVDVLRTALDNLRSQLCQPCLATGIVVTATETSDSGTPYCEDCKAQLMADAPETCLEDLVV